MKKIRILLSRIAILLILLSCNNSKNTDMADIKSPSFNRGMPMITPDSNWWEGLPSGNEIIGQWVMPQLKQNVYCSIITNFGTVAIFPNCYNITGSKIRIRFLSRSL